MASDSDRQKNRLIVSEIFNQVDGGDESPQAGFPKRRRDPQEIVKENSPEFLYVRYPISNSGVIEHPIPKQKFLEFEEALASAGKMSIFEVIAKFKFRKNDRVPLMALIVQSGYQVDGQMIYAKISKVA